LLTSCTLWDVYLFELGNACNFGKMEEGFISQTRKTATIAMIATAIAIVGGDNKNVPKGHILAVPANHAES